MKNLLYIAAFLSLSASADSLDLGAKCEKALKQKVPDCQAVKELGVFSENSQNYALLMADCKVDDFESSVLMLISKDKNGCRLLDHDTSFVGYMFGVDDDLKSNQSIAVYEKAILAEVNFYYKDKNARKAYLKKLRADNAKGELSEDQKWVLQYLEKNTEN